MLKLLPLGTPLLEPSDAAAVRKLGAWLHAQPNGWSAVALELKDKYHALQRELEAQGAAVSEEDAREDGAGSEWHTAAAMARQLDARVARRRAAVACRLMPARLSPAPYMPGPTPDVPWDPPTSAGRPARTELICLLMRTRGSLLGPC